eukprot:GEZU01025345.1.p1 GENE.GEZU01025345.1~~GEZU01025345.1.p1  ORF type:complete len:385 (+),score=68.61 GEZU01025345.1:54-1208(+)
MTRINITTPETSSISAHLAALSARSLIDSAIDGFRNMDWKTKLIITSSVASIVGKRLYKYWKNRVRRNTIIELDLDFKMIVETPPTRLPIPTPGGDTPHKVCLHDIVDALHRAAKDPRVVGLIVRIGQTTMGLAQAQELRSALVEFKKSGKPAICFAETFGELASGTTSYYVASACELYMCPSGDVNTTGVLAESVFVKNMLDKIGVQIRADKRKEYKNALNTFTEEGFTEAHREAMQRLSDSLFVQIVRDIAQSRGFASEDELRKVIDKGPFIGKEAVDHKLVRSSCSSSGLIATTTTTTLLPPTLLRLRRSMVLHTETKCLTRSLAPPRPPRSRRTSSLPKSTSSASASPTPRASTELPTSMAAVPSCEQRARRRPCGRLQA